MDTLMDGKRSRATLDPDFGREPSGRELPPRKSQRDADVDAGRRCPARSDVATDNPVFAPPFLGSRVVEGHLARRHRRYINETALFRNQWQFRPEKAARTTTSSRPASGPMLREQLAEAKADGRARARRSSTATSRPTATATTSSSGRTRRAPRSGCASVPAPAARSRSSASPTSSGRSTSRRGRLRRLPHRHDGRRVSARPRAELFADDQYQDYLLLHGLGVEMAEALAELLAPPHPRGVGLRRRGRPVARRPVPPAVPRRPLLVGLPGVPRPRGQREGRRAARRRPHRRRVLTEETGSSTSPSRRTSAIICHHPEAKYFVV